MRELNQAHGIGYNAITNVADLLQIKNGIISLQPQYDMSDVFERDSRWNESLLTEFITMLNRFYDKSNFQKFYKNHQNYIRSQKNEWIPCLQEQIPIGLKIFREIVGWFLS